MLAEKGLDVELQFIKFIVELWSVFPEQITKKQRIKRQSSFVGQLLVNKK